MNTPSGALGTWHVVASSAGGGLPQSGKATKPKTGGGEGGWRQGAVAHARLVGPWGCAPGAHPGPASRAALSDGAGVHKHAKQPSYCCPLLVNGEAQPFAIRPGCSLDDTPGYHVSGQAFGRCHMLFTSGDAGGL